MRHDECIRRGIRIGSGVFERLGQQLVGKRLKRPGSRFSNDGSNRLIAISSCLHNNRWADFPDRKANLAVAA